MSTVKCGNCGRSYTLSPDQLGMTKCKCGAILEEQKSGAASSGAAQGAIPGNDLEAVNRLKQAYDALREELSQVIVGQERVVEELLIAVFARGHCLLEGVPGLAKTLLISTL